jgi:hypothetical protein
MHLRQTGTAILIALILFTSCTKHGAPPQPGLIGNWSLKQVEGGIAGIVIKVPADSPVILTLKSDSSFVVYDRFVLVGSGTYHLLETPIYSNTPQPAISFSPLIPPTSYRISHDSLFLGEDFDDDFQRIYVKVN